MKRLLLQGLGCTTAVMLLMGCSASDPVAFVEEIDTLAVRSVVFRAGELSVDLSHLVMEVGDSVDIQVAPYNLLGNLLEDVPVEWTSTVARVASVSDQGVVEAVSEGRTDIAASAGDYMGILPAQVYGAPDTIGLVAADGFESGDMSYRENGFSWLTPGQVNGSVSVSSGNARGGTNSLRFRFNGVSSGNDSWVEQRFAYNRIDRAAWVEFYIYIPANYRHRNEPDTEHHKLYSLWGVDYIGSGRPKTVLELWRIDDNTSELRFVQNMAGQASSEQFGTREVGISSAGPLVRGRWHRIRIYQDTGTPGSDNAAFKMMIDERMIFDFANIPNMDAGAFYWDGGYLMGATNGGFDEQTDFYIDDFRIYDSDPSWW